MPTSNVPSLDGFLRTSRLQVARLSTTDSNSIMSTYKPQHKTTRNSNVYIYIYMYYCYYYYYYNYYYYYYNCYY